MTSRFQQYMIAHAFVPVFKAHFVRLCLRPFDQMRLSSLLNVISSAVTTAAVMILAWWGWRIDQCADLKRFYSSVAIFATLNLIYYVTTTTTLLLFGVCVILALVIDTFVILAETALVIWGAILLNHQQASCEYDAVIAIVIILGLRVVIVEMCNRLVTI